MDEDRNEQVRNAGRTAHESIATAIGLVDGLADAIARGGGGAEVTLARRRLQEARFWIEEAARAVLG